MATLQRTSISEFALRNPIYAAAEVSFYTIDDDGVKTTTLATLYEAATGSETLDNPQTLDGTGKFARPVYVAVPVIAVVESDVLGTEETGIIAGNLAGEAAVTAGAARDQALSYMAEADRIRKATEEAGLVLPLEISDLNVPGFIATLLDDTDAATARATLGVTALSDITITAGETLTVNATNGLAVVYQDLDNERGGGASKWYLVDADATGPIKVSKRVGIITANVANGANGQCFVRPALITGLSSLTANVPVWVHGSTAGAITQTEPTIPANNTQIATRQIGTAYNTTALDFNPDPDTLFIKYMDDLANGSGTTLTHWADAGARDRVAAAYAAIAGSNGTYTSPALGSDGTGLTNYSVRVLIPAANISTSGSSITVNVTGAGSATQIDRMYIGEKAGSGNAWDYASAPTQILFGGNANVTVSGAAVTTSDAVSFSLDESKSYLIGVDIANNASQDDIRENTSTGGSYAYYQKAAANGEANQTTPSGYTELTTRTAIISAIDVQQASRDEPVFVTADSIGAANAVTCRYDDGAGANGSTQTTFKNKTGATRDLILEITL